MPRTYNPRVPCLHTGCEFDPHTLRQTFRCNFRESKYTPLRGEAGIDPKPLNSKTRCPKAYLYSDSSLHARKFYSQVAIFGNTVLVPSGLFVVRSQMHNHGIFSRDASPHPSQAEIPLLRVIAALLAIMHCLLGAQLRQQP